MVLDGLEQANKDSEPPATVPAVNPDSDDTTITLEEVQGRFDPIWNDFLQSYPEPQRVRVLDLVASYLGDKRNAIRRKKMPK